MRRGEEDPIPRWAKPIIARGPRPVFEMEQILPGEDPDDLGSDPIIEANDHKEAGDRAGAYRILMDLLPGGSSLSGRTRVVSREEIGR